MGETSKRTGRRVPLERRSALWGGHRNWLLAAVPEHERTVSTDRSRVLTLQRGDVLFSPGEVPGRVWFPESALLSLFATFASGVNVEVGVIGRDGSTGVPLLFGGGALPNLGCMVQTEGTAVVIDADTLADALTHRSALRRAMELAAVVLMTEISQLVACNAIHTTTQRVARRLLVTRARSVGNEFSLTHESLAYVLGVRRASITVAAQMLQEAGIISYRRGIVTVLDPARLESSSCECFALIEGALDDLYEALFSDDSAEQEGG